MERQPTGEIALDSHEWAGLGDMYVPLPVPLGGGGGGLQLNGSDHLQDGFIPERSGSSAAAGGYMASANQQGNNSILKLTIIGKASCSTDIEDTAMEHLSRNPSFIIILQGAGRYFHIPLVPADQLNTKSKIKISMMRH